MVEYTGICKHCYRYNRQELRNATTLFIEQECEHCGKETYVELRGIVGW
jgi:hypothetical protein